MKQGQSAPAVVHFLKTEAGGGLLLVAAALAAMLVANSVTLPLQTRPTLKLGWTGILEGNHAPEALHAGGDRREAAAG